jgi:hypothetical protein
MYSVSFLKKLKKINDFQVDKPMVWFRGHSNHNFKLQSGLYRMNFRKFEDYISTEQSFYNMYLHYGHSLHKTSDWDLLYIMQHHGVRTRLLDWSESFSVSLYFAFLNWNPEETNCTVWLLDPIQLNDMFHKDFGLYMPKPYESYQNLLYNHGDRVQFDVHTVALFPRKNNPRLIAQQGTFTLQGNTRLPLEDEYDGQLWERRIITRVDFTIEDYSDIKTYLRLNGMNHFSLFPDLDGLAKFIMIEDSKYISQVTQEAPDIT